MNEIEKMYENVKLTNLYCGDDYIAEYMLQSECTNDNEEKCKTCDKVKISYPPFTAEKQLELLKLLIRHYKTEIYCRYANDKYKLIIYTEDCCTSDMDSFENALASVVCDIWGLLTEEEKQQIKDILK